MDSWRRYGALAAAIAIAIAASGCGDTVIDNAKAEGAIKANLEKSVREKISAVDCPSNQKVEAGKQFTCTIEYSNGAQATATLKIRNKDADVSFVGLKLNK